MFSQTCFILATKLKVLKNLSKNFIELINHFWGYNHYNFIQFKEI